MSIVIVAILTPVAGATQKVIDGFEQQSPLAHQEEGCELYSVGIDQDGLVVVIERWASAESIQKHGTGPVFARLMELIGDSLAKPLELHQLTSIPIGDLVKGTIQ